MPFARSAAIVEAIVTLGRSLGLRVNAEGIENEDQAELLRRLGCDEAQGYLYTKPLPETECTKFLLSRHRSAA